MIDVFRQGVRRHLRSSQVPLPETGQLCHLQEEPDQPRAARREPRGGLDPLAVLLCFLYGQVRGNLDKVNQGTINIGRPNGKGKELRTVIGLGVFNHSMVI